MFPYTCMKRQKFKKLFTAAAVSLSKLTWDLSKIILTIGTASILMAVVADSIKIKKNNEL